MATDNDKTGRESETVAEAARKASEEMDMNSTDVLEDIRKLVNESMETMQGMANEYYERMGEVAGQVAGEAGKIYEDGQDYVRRYPGPMLTGAFAFGVLIGVLIRR